MGARPIPRKDTGVVQAPTVAQMGFPTMGSANGYSGLLAYEIN